MTLDDQLGFSAPATRPPYENWKTDYRVGIAGFHWVIPTMHVPAYRAARIPIQAFSEIDPQRIQHGHDCEIPHYEADFQALVQRDDVDVLDSCFGHRDSGLERRLALIESCGQAGKSLLIHKPVAYDLAVAHQFQQIAKEHNIHLAVNQDARYNPATYAIKELLQPQRMGKPCFIELQMHWTGRKQRDPNNHDPATLQHHIHHADLINWWFDDQCTSVYAKASNHTTTAIYEFDNGCIAQHTESHDGLGSEHECKIRITTECGVIDAGHNWNWHLAASTGFDYVHVYPLGHQQAIEIPLPRHMSEPHWSGFNKWVPCEGPYYDLAAPVAGMMGSMCQLMRAVETGAKPDNDISTAISSLRISLAAEQSIREGRAVHPLEIAEDSIAMSN